MKKNIPTSIKVSGWFMIVTGIFSTFALLLSSASFLSLSLMFLQVAAGFALLRGQKFGYYATIGIIIYAIINLLILILAFNLDTISIASLTIGTLIRISICRLV